MPSSSNHRYDSAISELREQGLQVTVHSEANETWYVKEEGRFNGYTVTGTELLVLKRADQLNIRGIQLLG